MPASVLLNFTIWWYFLCLVSITPIMVTKPENIVKGITHINGSEHYRNCVVTSISFTIIWDRNVPCHWLIFGKNCNLISLVHEGRTNSVFPNFELRIRGLNWEMCSELGEPLPKIQILLQKGQIFLQSCNHPQHYPLNRFIRTSSSLDYIIKMPPDIS